MALRKKWKLVQSLMENLEKIMEKLNKKNTGKWKENAEKFIENFGKCQEKFLRFTQGSFKEDLKNSYHKGNLKMWKILRFP